VNIPPYITPGEVGEACGTDQRTAKRLLQRAGILEKIGGHWSVGDSRLRERLPEVYERVYTYFSALVETDTNRPKSA
jgi:hypothetical protein